MCKIKTTLIISILFMIVGCRPVQRLTANPKTASLELGMVGNRTNTLTENELAVFGTLRFFDKVRLRVTLRPFRKSDLKAYKRFKGQRELPYSVNYVDSLPQKPEYATLQLMDKTRVIESINNATNLPLRNNTKTNTESVILTGLDLVMSQERIGQLKKAEALFLVSGKDGVPYLQVVVSNDKINIPFSETVTLSYEVSGFCWGLDKYSKPEIMGLRSPNAGCSGNLERRASKLNMNEKYFKF